MRNLLVFLIFSIPAISYSSSFSDYIKTALECDDGILKANFEWVKADKTPNESLSLFHLFLYESSRPNDSVDAGQDLKNADTVAKELQERGNSTISYRELVVGSYYLSLSFNEPTSNGYFSHKTDPVECGTESQSNLSTSSNATNSCTNCANTTVANQSTASSQVFIPDLGRRFLFNQQCLSDGSIRLVAFYKDLFDLDRDVDMRGLEAHFTVESTDGTVKSSSIEATQEDGRTLVGSFRPSKRARYQSKMLFEVADVNNTYVLPARNPQELECGGNGNTGSNNNTASASSSSNQGASIEFDNLGECTSSSATGIHATAYFSVRGVSEEALKSAGDVSGRITHSNGPESMPWQCKYDRLLKRYVCTFISAQPLPSLSLDNFHFSPTISGHPGIGFSGRVYVACDINGNTEPLKTRLVVVNRCEGPIEYASANIVYLDQSSSQSLTKKLEVKSIAPKSHKIGDEMIEGAGTLSGTNALDWLFYNRLQPADKPCEFKRFIESPGEQGVRSIVMYFEVRTNP